MTSVQIDAWEVLGLLGDPVRRRIVALLAREELCTCHLVAELGLKQPLVSHHLKALRGAGVVQGSPCGRYTYYRLRPEAVRAAAGMLHGLVVDEPGRRPC